MGRKVSPFYVVDYLIRFGGERGGCLCMFIVYNDPEMNFFQENSKSMDNNDALIFSDCFVSNGFSQERNKSFKDIDVK